jgi:uncharacterized paraquat-inducible protein A
MTVRHVAYPPGYRSADAPSLPRRVWNYVRAEVGPRQPLTGAEAQARLVACESCDYCEREGDQLYCTKCGCGARPRAELHKKITMKWARCPLGKWKV